MTGRTLGHYQVLEALGAGGMGEVFKARDTRLNRFVAIKVLRGALVANTDRRQRFVQEAQAASALNHPNIVTIHDVFQHEGVDCLVMEYVAGKTLDAVIPRTGMRLNEALRVAVQVAEGLRKAHAAGIVHRDIKPSNIMVGDDGPVKVLDFGLAKLTEAAGTSENDATLTQRPETEEGTVMGTVAYMSPEQAEGLKVDARTDVFSFGALLYEMVTGRRAFGGSSKLSTMSAILKEEPKPVEGVPADLEKIIRRCLRKDREKRYQHMDDLKLALEEVREESASGKAVVGAAKPAGRRWVWAAVLAVVGVGVGLGWRFWPRVEEAPAGPMTLTRVTTDAGLATMPALSPDGKLLAYSSDQGTNGENLDIWVRHVAGSEATRLTKDEGDELEPEFTADGGQIAYSSGRGGIWIVSALGGEPRQLSAKGIRPRFSPDGKWLAYELSAAATASGTTRREIWIMPATGGEGRRIAADFLDCAAPVWAPDSKQLLFYGRKNADETEWWLGGLDGGAPTAVGIMPLLRAAKLANYNFPRVWKKETVVFAGNELTGSVNVNLWRVRMVTGKASGRVEQITFGTGREIYPAMSDDGTLALAGTQFRSDLWMLRADTANGKLTGELERLTDDPASDDTVSISEDGRRLVFNSNRDGKRGLWLRDMETGKMRKISSGPVLQQWPQLSSDGRKAGYSKAFASGVYTYAVAGVDDGSLRELAIHTTAGPWGLSPTGKYVLTSRTDRVSIIAVNVEGGESLALAHRDWALLGPAFSGDERWLAFHANNSDLTRQIWVAPFHYGNPAEEKEWIAITDGKELDRNPIWSPDGKMLYWLKDRNGARGIWACRIDPAKGRKAGEPFEVRMFRGARRSMMGFGNSGLSRVGVGRDKLVFPLGEEVGNIWMGRPPKL